MNVYIAVEWSSVYGHAIISPHKTLEGAKEAYNRYGSVNEDTEWIETDRGSGGRVIRWECRPDANHTGMVFLCEVQS